MISNTAYSYMDESSIHELLKCKLCKKPFVDPVTTEKGDCFCRGCISQILRRDISDEYGKLSLNQNNQPSPKLQTLTPVTEKLVLDMLASLPVRCLDCGEINISRGELEEHKTRACIQATVLCTAADLKCSWIGARQNLDEHLEVCKYEPLRSALQDVFNELHQLKQQVSDLQAQVDTLKDDNYQ